MQTLFIDTHNQKIRLALLKDEKIFIEKKRNEKLDHSTIVMPTLINMLEEVNVNVKDLDDIIVVNGPGSFTGERLGVTIAKTLAYTLNIPIRTITSIETSLASMNLTENTYLSLEEKNGYFLAEFNKKKNLIKEYQYLKRNEYEEFINKHQVIECLEYLVESAVSYAHQFPAKNPHQVNPFYVKKIEVEK